jgi:chromosomal replication initiator protein
MFVLERVQKKYKSEITEAASEVFHNPQIKVDIILENKNQKGSLKPKPQKNDTGSATKKYRFENFIEGESNRLAYSSSIAVARNPGEDSSLNPLFIYGDSGLGKTHLMYAIKNEITSTLTEKNVLYVSCEELTNDLVTGIKNKKTEAVRDKYRTVDVLLIDDIQFTIDKEGTQMEIFNTFNELINSDKQIILSSDRPPDEMRTLDKRLRSRFGAGFIVDIQPPGYETRLAIIESKAKEKGVDCPREISEYIAENIKSNIRQLENALNQVIMYAKFDSKPLNIDTAKRALKNLITPEEKSVISFDKIKEVVADYYSITVDDLNSKRRPNTIAKPRQIAMYLCKKLVPESTYKNIGKSFNKDHSTVIFAEAQVLENPSLSADAELLEKKIITQC